MSDFERRLDNIDRLIQLPNKPVWWKDMLSLWRPSGFPSETHGLRLAIRNNYINFYRRGQSIARIHIRGDGTPVANIHVKYVSDPGEAHSYAQEYVTLKEGELWRNGQPWRAYEGIDTLKRWIDVVNGEDGNEKNKRYSGSEKEFVDSVVGDNPNVIDLEMGLPAWGEKTAAPRMDLVAIGAHLDKLQVIFWEAKHILDGRIRSSTQMVPGENPKVLKQLSDYKDFLSGAKNAEQVAVAYVNAAKLLKKFSEMAEVVREKFPLGDRILALASDAALDIDDTPRLLVFKAGKINEAAWFAHADKLKRAGVAMQIVESNRQALLKDMV